MESRGKAMGPGTDNIGSESVLCFFLFFFFPPMVPSFVFFIARIFRNAEARASFPFSFVLI